MSLRSFGKFLPTYYLKNNCSNQERHIKQLMITRNKNFLFQYISNKMQRYTVYLYLEAALHVSGVTSTHPSGARTTVSTASGICHTVTATCHYRGRVGTSFQLFHEQINLYALLMMSGSNTQNTQSSFQIQINYVKLHIVGYILKYICNALTH